MSLGSLAECIQHHHSLPDCWLETSFACVDLTKTGAEASEWSQGESWNLKNEESKVQVQVQVKFIVKIRVPLVRQLTS